MKVSNIERSKFDVIHEAALDVLSTKQQIEVADVFNHLLNHFPNQYWLEAEVSDTLWSLAEDGKLQWMGIGTYSKTQKSQTMSLKELANMMGITMENIEEKSVYNKSEKKKMVKKTISRTKAVELMENSKGKFFTATFLKKDGTERTINCQYQKGQKNKLGYIGVHEAKLMKKVGSNNNSLKSINAQTITGLKLSGVVYKIK